jgi:hypothetical protein
MLINNYKKHFFTELSNLYPLTEIQSFFNILIEFKLNLSRVELALQPNCIGISFSRSIVKTKKRNPDTIYFR